MKFTLFMLLALFSTSAKAQNPCPPDRAPDAPCGDFLRFSEHGNIRWRDEQARLDVLASQFRRSPKHLIHFLVYAGIHSCKDEAGLRALRAKKYLVQHHSIPPKNISWKDGGILSELSFEIWLLRPDQPLPEPNTFNTIDLAAVKPQRKCRQYRRAKP